MVWINNKKTIKLKTKQKENDRLRKRPNPLLYVEKD